MAELSREAERMAHSVDMEVIGMPLHMTAMLWKYIHTMLVFNPGHYARYNASH